MKTFLILILLLAFAQTAPAATFVVNSTEDLDDWDGVIPCDATDGQGKCTLRAAIYLAEWETPGEIDTIILPAGTYPITQYSGFVIGRSTMSRMIEIVGAGARTTSIVDARTNRAPYGLFRMISPAELRLRNLTLENGVTEYGGGAIRNEGDDNLVELIDVTIRGSRAGESGGAIANWGLLSLNRVTLTGNSSGRLGGAIFHNNGQMTLRNVTISGNRASNGGGGIWFDYPISLTNVTVHANSSTSGSSAIGTFGGVTAQVSNSLVAGGGIACTESLSSTAPNLATDSSCGFSVAADLRLGPLQNNGGETDTHALLAGSPAIDAGAGGCASEDQRGVSRPLGASCDLGAFEAAAAAVPAVFTVTKRDDTADGRCDSDCSLREAVIAANASSAPDTILVPAGTYSRDLDGPDDRGGDLDITDHVTINGAGATTTILDVNGLDRVFHVHPNTNVTITGMRISFGAATGGAGILFEGGTGTLTLDHVTLRFNISLNGGPGGGIWSRGGELNIVDSTIEKNETTGVGGAGPGAGIALYGDTRATIKRSTISENIVGVFGSGGPGGGGIYMHSDSPSLTIENSTISGNLVRSTFSFDPGGHGGGIYHLGGALSVANTTFAENGAAQGSALFTTTDFGATATVKNTLISRRLFDGGPWNCWPFTGTAISLGNNLADDSTCSFSAVAPDLKLDYLKNNGGPTATHALLAGSPALDSGTDCLNADQRGVSRPQGARCDIGAFELEVTTPSDSTPPVVAAPLSTPANAAGWHRGPVTVSWSVNDSESQISSSTGCETVTLSDETAGTTLTCSVTNSAGLTTTQSITIRIDLTAPSISFGSSSPVANDAGWYNTDVSFGFTASDSLSGVATVSPESPLLFTSEGAGQTRSVTVVDVAGNTTTVSSPAVNIDKTAPAVEFGSPAPAPNAAGWNNTDVTFSFSANDGLSGVASVSPASPFVFSSEGPGQTVEVTVTDFAGNTAKISSPTVNIDKTPAQIDFGAASPAANAAGWNNSGVSLEFAAVDALSGVASVSPANPLVFSTEGAGQKVDVTVSDVAGNVITRSSPVINIDKTAPQIAGGSSPAANPAGWNNTDVTVSFSCSDGLSGIAICPADQVLTSEGAGQSLSGSAVDIAGNVTSATVSDINIDKTAPTLSCSASPSSIWPPDHKLKLVNIQLDVKDGLSGAGAFTLKSTSSNEPDNGLGDGDTSADIQGFAVGTADLQGLLRAERSAKGTGRIYTLGYEARDLAGNVASCAAKVSVPRNAK